METFASGQTDIHEDCFIIINEMIPKGQTSVSGPWDWLLVNLGENPPLLWPLTFNFSSWSAPPQPPWACWLRGAPRRREVRAGSVFVSVWENESGAVSQSVQQGCSLLGDGVIALYGRCSGEESQFLWRQLVWDLKGNGKKKGCCFCLLVWGQIWCHNRDDLINRGIKNGFLCACSSSEKHVLSDWGFVCAAAGAFTACSCLLVQSRPDFRPLCTHQAQLKAEWMLLNAQDALCCFFRTSRLSFWFLILLSLHAPSPHSFTPNNICCISDFCICSSQLKPRLMW